MNNTKRILRGELIGLTTKVIGSENTSNIGIEGRIIDESKHMLTIETSKGTKRLIKKQNTFMFTTNKKSIKINGKKLLSRPEERIKL